MNFIGGRNIFNTCKKIKQLQSSYKFKPILDYAKESSFNKKAIDKNINNIKNDIESCSLDNFSFSLKLSTFGNNEEKLKKLIGNVIKNNNLKYIFLDAEHSSVHEKEIYNKVIRYFNDKDLSGNINTKGKIFKTYQMYKKNSFDDIKHDIQTIPNLGIKLVRGAYLDLKDPDFFHNKKDTDQNYDDTMTFLLKNSVDYDYKLMVATHNEVSINLCVNLLKQYNISVKNDKVLFGQLLGFKDSMSSRLSKDGYEVYKYIPYGSYYTLLPYLIRRLYENYPMLQHINIVK